MILMLSAQSIKVVDFCCLIFQKSKEFHDEKYIGKARQWLKGTVFALHMSALSAESFYLETTPILPVGTLSGQFNLLYLWFSLAASSSEPCKMVLFSCIGLGSWLLLIYLLFNAVVF